MVLARHDGSAEHGGCNQSRRQEFESGHFGFSFDDIRPTKRLTINVWTAGRRPNARIAHLISTACDPARRCKHDRANAQHPLP
jgi:hypothetical protein